jgi:hypothetical protein
LPVLGERTVLYLNPLKFIVPLVESEGSEGSATEAELKAETTEATTGIKVINFDSALKNFLQIPAAGFFNDLGGG